MPLSHHRPQTSKAAKKAYRKSGATVRLSASELAVIERRAVLQERADRIKERELRRKANIKRRDERNQREKDARVRMGISSPVDGTKGIRVGPSQLHLGDFMGLGKRKRDENTVEEEDADTIEAGEVELSGMGSRGCQMSSRPWRNPLQIISANPISQSYPLSGGTKALRSSAKAGSPLARSEASIKPPAPSSQTPPRLKTSSPIDGQQSLSGLRDSEAAPKEQTSREGPPKTSIGIRTSQGQGQWQSRPSGSIAKHDPPVRTKENEVPEEKKANFTGYTRTPMGPPPLPKPLEAKPTNTTIQRKPPLLTPQHRAPSTVEDTWDDFFVSNTQIGRELSPSPTDEIPTPVLATKSAPTVAINPPLHQEDNTGGLLDMLCTQDLDFSDTRTQIAPAPLEDSTDNLLAQISTQDLDFSIALTQTIPEHKASSFDSHENTIESDSDEPHAAPEPGSEIFEYDDEVTEEDLEDLSSGLMQAVPNPATQSFDFSEDVTEEDLEDLVLEFELESTGQSHHTSPVQQESLEEAQLAAECEAFDFSTQDLRELES